MTVFVALDQGTTSSRALVFEQSGRILGSYQTELKQIYPKARLGGTRSPGDSLRAD